MSRIKVLVLSCLGILSIFLYGCIANAPEITTKNVEISHTESVVKSTPAPMVISSPPPSPSYELTKKKSSGLIGNPNSNKLLIVRAFAYQADKKFETKSNFLLFAKRPATKADLDRYIFICEQWKASFPTADEVPAQTVDMQIILFVWLLNKKVASKDCSTLVNNYDYGRARLLSQRFDLDITKMYIVFSYPKALVTMDLTPVATEEDLVLAIDTWKRNMATLPKKSGSVSIYNLVYSTKAVLGALAELVTFKG